MSIMRLRCISHHRGTLIKVLHAPRGEGIREILVIQRLLELRLCNLPAQLYPIDLLNVVILNRLHRWIRDECLTLALMVRIILMKHGKVDIFSAGLLLQILIYVSCLTYLSEIWGLPLGRLLNPSDMLCLNDNSHQQFPVVYDLLVVLGDCPKHTVLGQETDYEDTTYYKGVNINLARYQKIKDMLSFVIYQRNG